MYHELRIEIIRSIGILPDNIVFDHLDHNLVTHFCQSKW
jgi:hypothetical protein